ncbi:DUF3465 domain-containing protein [Shewanella algidipiscicola]|uniref:DUF3465 domain-containing protein n=1 Tax=Shewanella algidipiscicola TaxID=614070 RepID=UPI000D78C7CF|nr:DUF3465 domain-containing protein [Shewanella algidipiscicola]
MKQILTRILLSLTLLSLPVWANDALLQQAYESQQSDIQVQGEGIVSRVLADDDKGSRHQRFILRLDNRQSILIAHNIDIAPRIPNLTMGDTVQFYGEYEWNKKGGVIHWTHKDPNNRHPHGWLKHKGIKYQ